MMKPLPRPRLAILAPSLLLFAVPVSATGALSPQGSMTLTRIQGGPSVTLPDGEVLMLGDLVELPAQEGEEQEATEANSKEDEAWLKEFKKLKFKRRPSQILEAWSTPLEKPEGLLEDGAEPQDTAGAEKSEGEPTADAPEESGAGAATPEPPASETKASEEPADAASEEPADEHESATTEPSAEEEEESKASKEAADKAKREAEKKEKERRQLERSFGMQRFERQIILGIWEGARTYLGEQPEKRARQAYAHLLESLAKDLKQPNGQDAEYAEMPFYEAADLVGLAAIALGKPKAAELGHLGRILRHTVDEGALIEQCLTEFRRALKLNGFPLTNDQLAHVLLEANFPAEAGEFLPALAEAQEAEDRPLLNLLARHYLARYRREKDTPDLLLAWEATQSALLPGEIEDKVREEALRRAVTIAPQIDEELGAAWLNESFSERSEIGMEILSIIGATASTSLRTQIRDKDTRLQSLTIQATAAEALIEHNPELARKWRGALGLLANNWLQEAFFTYSRDTTSSRGQNMRFDPYGNVYYSSYSSSPFSRNNQAPVPTNDLLDIRPGQNWLELISAGLRPKFNMVTAQLLLKVEAEEEAFPYIESLARVYPDQAEALVEEFLRVWIKNHNPNSSTGNTNNYMFIYGFDARQAGIPLTRSKQERNLSELTDWISRIRELPLERVDEELVAQAFTTAHSTAEVYKLETIERVFGALGSLEARTTAALVQKMRSNLVSVWRRPSTQEDKQTKRRQKDIEQEIVRGYGVAAEVTSKALGDHPEDWALSVAAASIAHDENNFRQELEKTPEFTSRRHNALAGFSQAADYYSAILPTLKEKEQTVSLFETWFYASLGACDLEAIKSTHLSAQGEFAKIRTAILSLPDGAAERHMGKFANTLVTRIGNVNPAAKYRFLKAGLEIAGDHEQTREARKIFEYYGDLVTEITLETVVDGTDHVGHGEPFGLFVNLHHTAAIEREAGGFGKYLVNQNTQTRGFNYGRPTEDYRDKFEEFAREVLTEHFTVRSVTFNHPETHSRATAEYGWRSTPYAYILLESRGPEIDRIPALRLDLDFMDSAGYAVLPIESAPLPIDSLADQRDERPFEELTLTQTLDEREAADGKLKLELRATALGLLPELDALVELAHAGFDVTGTEDMDVSVLKFDEESSVPLVVAERTWTMTFAARNDLKRLPEGFTFASVRAGNDEAELTYQRFVDADLATVGPTVVFEERYGEVAGSGPLPWLVGLAVLVVLVLGGRHAQARRNAARIVPQRFRIPDELSPFSVLGLLRQIEAADSISADFRSELLGEIAQLETHFFRDDSEEAPDLTHIAHTWVSRTS